MRMPNGDRAEIREEKLTDFLLNVEHPEQPGDAILFRELLSIERKDVERLREALAHAAATGEAVAGRRSPYGQKYEIRFEMTGPRGTYSILSIWTVEHGSTTPRLVTAYIE